jgi:peptide deformylase
VVDPHDERKLTKPMALINPELVAADGQIVEEEGCLCIPDLREGVPRFKRVVVKAYDRNEQEVVLEASDLLARILQHEIDHLNGVLFIDRLSPAKRQLVKRRLKKAAKE